MRYNKRLLIISFASGVLVYLFIQLFVQYNWNDLYAPYLDPGLQESFDRGFIKPYFNLTTQSLIHTEIIITIGTVLFCCFKAVRKLRYILTFAFGVYITAFVFGFFQNSDSGLWPFALFLFAFYFIGPILLIGTLFLYSARLISGKKS